MEQNDGSGEIRRNLGRELFESVRDEADLERAAFLIGLGADPNFFDECFWTPLMLAAQFGNPGMVDLLIKNGADPLPKNFRGWDALMIALYNYSDGRFQKIVDSLIAHGADVDSRNGAGDTPLILAASRGLPDAIASLLAAGADHSAVSDACVTALSAAVGARDFRSADLVIKKGADVDQRPGPDGRTMLMDAASAGDVETIRFLVPRGANVNSKNAFGVTALQWAVQQGRDAAARELIAAGADVGACDREGQTILMVACFRAALMGEPAMREIVRTLCEKGADVDKKKKGGWTALMWAADIGDAETVKILCEAGADRSLKNDAGDDALGLARKRSRESVAEYLGGGPKR